MDRHPKIKIIIYLRPFWPICRHDDLHKTEPFWARRFTTTTNIMQPCHIMYMNVFLKKKKNVPFHQ